ncbi:hypothetical protein E1A91_D04G159700v1 [Gossypium mustelinum]|uniref:Uncharacterized protein n=1 Tax=Gossypium mustelinum TaxID=34275 RepID=A0A5D2VFX7_GOSMU|nr:hypothetical protein E1A91_D04G159700v1 [Gossypium mustelinum]
MVKKKLIRTSLNEDEADKKTDWCGGTWISQVYTRLEVDTRNSLNWNHCCTKETKKQKNRLSFIFNGNGEI